MVYTKAIKIKSTTDEMLRQCITEFLSHHPELEHIPISRNKIVYEIAKFYLKVKV